MCSFNFSPTRKVQDLSSFRWAWKKTFFPFQNSTLVFLRELGELFLSFKKLLFSSLVFFFKMHLENGCFLTSKEDVWKQEAVFLYKFFFSQVSCSDCATSVAKTQIAKNVGPRAAHASLSPPPSSCLQDFRVFVPSVQWWQVSWKWDISRVGACRCLSHKSLLPSVKTACLVPLFCTAVLAVGFESCHSSERAWL